MTSFDSGSGRDPIDPDFAALFRPEDVPAFRPADLPAPADLDDEPHFEPIVDPVVDPRDEDAAEAAASSAPEAVREPDEDHEPPADAEPHRPALPAPVVATDPVADTGRLFRSQGVVGHEEAVLAVTADRSGRLRTLERNRDTGPAAEPSAPPGHDADLGLPPAAAAAEGEEAVSGGRRARRRSPAQPEGTSVHGSRRITGGAAYIIVIGVTVLVGFANAVIADGDVGWPTGLALVVSGVYVALTVRREDDYVAIIVPPIAFLVVALTAGQLFLGSSSGTVLNRAVIVFFTLADNWFWIIGTTLAALVIVLVRRRRS